VPIYSTYLGGDGGGDSGAGVAVDAAGNLYVTGITTSTNFPTMNAYQANLTSMEAAFLTKFSPDGSQLVYSTYLNGTDQMTGGLAIAVDTQGRAYVTGRTSSSNFPTVQPIQATHGGTNNFEDAFLTQFSADGQTLLFSTYLGGTLEDRSYGVSLAYSPVGSAVLAGRTQSNDFPLRFAYQSTGGGASFPGPSTIFVSKFNFDLAAPEAAAPAIYFYQTETPTLTWSPVSDAASYHIQVDSSPTFAAPLDFEATVDGSLLSVTTDPLQNGLHYWRIQARHKNGTFSNWSATQTFAVRA
jgi:hypothetical protein